MIINKPLIPPVEKVQPVKVIDYKKKSDSNNKKFNDGNKHHEFAEILDNEMSKAKVLKR
jgi:hypothetical protein